MRARAAAIAALALLYPIAGCTVESPTLEGQLPSPGGGLVPAQGPPDLQNETTVIDLNLTAEQVVVPAPIWHIGDSWKWALDFGGDTGAQELVVVGDLGTDYLVATTDRDDAIRSAYFSASLPGKVAKATLGPYFEGSQASNFLEFPLQQNKTWTIRFGGTDYPMKANFTRALEGGFGPGFVMQGTDPRGERLTVAYAPSTKWNAKVLFTDPGGNVTFSRTQQGYNGNYTGPWFLGKSENLFVGQRSSSQPGVPTDTFTQARGYASLYASVACVGDGGHAEIRLLDAQNQPRFNYTYFQPGNDFQQAAVPSVPGAWRVVWTVSGFVECFFRVAGIDLTEGRL